MKLGTFVCCGMSITGILAISTPQHGTAVSKLRRAAEAVEELLEGPVDISAIEEDPSCYAVGGACDLAKREAAIIADIVAEAEAQASGDHSVTVPTGWCNVEGNYCDKLKREEDLLNAKASVVDAQEAHTEKRSLNSDYDDAILQSCKRPGGPCIEARSNLHNAINRFSEIQMDKRAPRVNRHPDSAIVGVNHNCHRIGEPCFKLKRAVDLIADLAAEDVDELNESEKQSLDPARKALSDIGKSVAKQREELIGSGILH